MINWSQKLKAVDRKVPITNGLVTKTQYDSDRLNIEKRQKMLIKRCLTLVNQSKNPITSQVTEIENKMPDIPNPSTKADPNTKVTDIKKKTPGTSHVIDTQEFNRLIKICFQSCH